MTAHVSKITADSSQAFHYRPVAIALGLLVCLLWSYWPTVVELCAFWARNDDYSIGALVPFLAGYLVWRNRDELQAIAARPCWWGLPAILAAQACRYAGLYFSYSSAERYSLVFTIAGGVLLVAGPRAFWRLRWILLFLLLMVPFPKRIHEMVAIPLQGMSTTMAVYSLELLGFFVVRTGNVLRIGSDVMVAVTEACSGLRLLTAFVFVAAVFAFVSRRPAWHKTILVLSSVSIAIVANALRLVVTSAYIANAGEGEPTEVFHDYAGLAMMPLAVLILLVEDTLMRGMTRVRSPCHHRRRAGPMDRSSTWPGQNPNREDEAATVHHMLRSQSRSLRLAVIAAGSCLLLSGVPHRVLHANLQQLSSAKVILDPPLSALPMVVGSWRGERVPLSAAVLRVAKNDDYISRRYVNRDTGEIVNLYVAYTARPRTMLGHRPRICFPSAGWLHESTKETRFETERASIPCLVHRFQEPGSGRGQQLVLNYYVLNGQPTIDESSFSSIRWRDPNLSRNSNRYVAQVQIVVPVAVDSVAAERTATGFAAASANSLLALLPLTRATAPGESEEN